nr:MAG TPA: Telomerase activating protein Est1 [Caudoviricetes sp.]
MYVQVTPYNCTILKSSLRFHKLLVCLLGDLYKYKHI